MKRNLKGQFIGGKDQKKRSKNFSKKWKYQEEYPVPVNHVNPNCKDPKSCLPHGEIGPVKTIINSVQIEMKQSVEKEWKKWIRSLITAVVTGIVIGLIITKFK